MDEATLYESVGKPVAGSNPVIGAMDAYEKAELEAEISRHHKDFSRISVIVESFFETRKDKKSAVSSLQQIRNIVG